MKLLTYKISKLMKKTLINYNNYFKNIKTTLTSESQSFITRKIGGHFWTLKKFLICFFVLLLVTLNHIISMKFILDKNTLKYYELNKVSNFANKKYILTLILKMLKNYPLVFLVLNMNPLSY